MKSFQVKGKEIEELEQLYKKLEHDWHAMKQSNLTTASRKYHAPSNTSIKPIQQLEYSPRHLMLKLQQESSSQAWKNVMMTRTKDFAAQEVLQERRDAIENGKLKGRRLFHPVVEGENADMGPHREVRSMSFHYSEDEQEDESSGSRGVHGCTRGCSHSSSSSSCLVGASVDKDQEVKGIADMVATVAEIRVATFGRRRRYAVFLGGLAFASLMIAMCMRLASSGGHAYDMILVPT